MTTTAAEVPLTYVGRCTPKLLLLEAHLSQPVASVTLSTSPDAPCTLRVFSINPASEERGLTLYGPVKDVQPGQSHSWTTVPSWQEKIGKRVKIDPEVGKLLGYQGKIRLVVWWIKDNLNLNAECPGGEEYLDKIRMTTITDVY